MRVSSVELYWLQCSICGVLKLIYILILVKYIHTSKLLIFIIYFKFGKINLFLITKYRYLSIYDGNSFHENCSRGEISQIKNLIPIALHVKVAELNERELFVVVKVCKSSVRTTKNTCTL